MQHLSCARAILPCVTLGAICWLAPAVASANSTARLFCIERNKNTNVVCYDARLRTDGKLDRGHPLEAYWVMRAENGRREELSWIERKLAYGFTVVGSANDSGFRFRLDALPGRVLDVRRDDQRLQAETTVAGRRSRLVGVYVQVKEAFKPVVRYVDLTGLDLEDGRRRVERVPHHS